jgi:DNA-binding SARP family transcriptional activator
MRSGSRPSSGMGEPAQEPDGQVFRLRTLGEASLVRAARDAEPAEILVPGKPFAVVVFLASAPGRSASRDRLIDLLWANLDLDAARHGLRQTLWYLRQRLGPGAIRSTDQEVRLLAPVESDRDLFLQAVERRDVERAVELYRGEFLPMFASPGGADFERWADMERFRLQAHCLEAAELLVWGWLEKGECVRAKEVAARVRDIHPEPQRAWRLLLEVLLAANDPVAARIEAEALERRLSDDGIRPDPSIEGLLAAARDPPEQPARKGPGPGLRPELVAREREFATILAAWRAATAGRGRHIHITGAPGLGKTRLLLEAHERLESRGAPVIHVRAPPGRREVEYALASDLAAALAALPGADRVSEGVATALAALNPALTDRFPVSADTARGAEALRRREIALAELLSATAADGPVALLVDDVHWADEASRQLLRSLCARVPDHAVLLATTSRPTQEGVLGGPHTETLTLEPFSAEEIGALLAGLGSLPDGDRDWATGLPHQLVASAAGSPLLVLEALRLALERGWLSLEDGAWDCPDPGRLEAELPRGGVLQRRVDELAAEERWLLLLLCVAGAPLSPSLLAAAADRDRDRVSSDLQNMEVRGLAAPEADRWSLVHDEICTAVLEVASPDEVRRAHHAVGKCLARDTGSDATAAQTDTLYRAARHLVAAGENRELAPVFHRWVEGIRQRGDRSPLRDLAADVIGSPPGDARVRHLIGLLPLATRLGLTPPRRRKLAVVAGGVAVLAAGLFAVAAPDRSPPDAVLVLVKPTPEGGFTTYQVPIRRAGWEAREAIDVTREGRRVSALHGLPVHAGHLLAGPPGRGWAYAAVVDEGWAPDLFLVRPGGQRERVTRVRGDDVPLSWSPDGASLVFTTGRWNPNYWQDLAVLDLETREIRPLVRSDASHGAAQWSPDGTRIVFRRQPNARTPEEVAALETLESQVCWVTADGSEERCLDLHWQDVYPRGWADANRVLATGLDSTGTSGLAEIDLGEEGIRMGLRGVVWADVSPDGRWVAVRREAVAGSVPGWYVYPAARPDLAVPLVGVEALQGSSVGWGHVAGATQYLDRLEIRAPDIARVGVPTRLRARGYDTRGRPIPLHTLAWGVADTAVADIDAQTGILTPRTAGTVEVRVSAGGWREATAEVSVRAPAHETLLVENWEGGFADRWVPFGNPPPAIALWPMGGRAFWNRGDGVYSSGVYSTEEFRTGGGLGLEAELATPRKAPRAQRVSVGFYAWTSPEAVAAWDHRTGSLRGGTARCHFTYPTGDGFHAEERAWAAGRRVAVDPAVATGEPYVLRLQIFPDGTCGMALNGTPLARGDIAMLDDVRDRVVLDGASLDTKMLVGRLEVWRGVRGGVDWAALELDREWSIAQSPPQLHESFGTPAAGGGGADGAGGTAGPGSSAGTAGGVE